MGHAGVLGAVALVAMVAGLAAGEATAQPVAWGDLQAGPHAVGFRLTTVLDRSRSFHSNLQVRGLPADTETSRPIRLYLWYPARATSQPPLHLRDYARMAADDFGLVPEGAEPADRSLPLPVPLAEGLEEPARLRLLAGATAAHMDSPPLDRRSPLIVLGQGLYYESPLSLLTLAEYLASHGYVVATCPLLGTHSRLVNRNVVDLETEVRDMEFVLAQASILPFVDEHRIGLVGYDLGGMAALLLAMRDPRIEAMVSLDTGILYSTSIGLPAGSPHYQVDRFRIPWMMMTQERFVTGRPQPDKEVSLFDLKAEGDSYLLLLDTENHGAFTSYAMFGIQSPVLGYWGPVTGSPKLLHETICRYTARFFDAYLGDNPAAQEALSRDPAQAGLAEVVRELRVKAGEVAAADQDAYVHDIISHGTAEALPRIRRALATPAGRPRFDEEVLNWLGYHFLYWWGRQSEAVEVFELVTELFPESGNAFDSLGEANLVLDRKTRALECYRKALQLNPDNANAREQVKRLVEEIP
jgi:pimeloyl-ACP methyl ester carboxylesterase